MLKLSMVNESEYYYKVRKEFNSLFADFVYLGENLQPGKDNLDFDILEKIGQKNPQKLQDKNRLAELFYYLNRCGFNGLWRVNSKGEYNVSYADYAYANPLNDLTKWHNQIQNWQLQRKDFEKLLKEDIKETDFLFVDPPYDVEFTKYNEDDFTWNDQIRLVKSLEKFVKNNPIILTNQYTERIYNLYKDNGYIIKEAYRSKNFKGKTSKESKKEIIALKNMKYYE